MAGTISPALSLVSPGAPVDSVVMASDTVRVTLDAIDASGRHLVGGGRPVHFTTAGGASAGTFVPFPDVDDGTYTALFVAMTAGTATTLGATIDGVPVTSTAPTARVVPGPASLSGSQGRVAMDTIAVGDSTTLTLVARDAFGNARTVSFAVCTMGNPSFLGDTLMDDQHFARATRSWTTVVVFGLLAVAGCSNSSTGPTTSGFRGTYIMDDWTASPITGGTTSVTPASGESDTAKFSYAVNLGNPGPGVSFRTAMYSTTAAASGPVKFDWVFSGYHAFFQVNGTFKVFAVTAANDTTFFTEVDKNVGGQSFSLSGSATIEVVSGKPFGVIIGGSNFDSDSRLIGTLTVFNFRAPA